jgi:hypothetical protein
MPPLPRSKPVRRLVVLLLVALACGMILEVETILPLATALFPEPLLGGGSDASR